MTTTVRVSVGGAYRATVVQTVEGSPPRPPVTVEPNDSRDLGFEHMKTNTFVITEAAADASRGTAAPTPESKATAEKAKTDKIAADKATADKAATEAAARRPDATVTLGRGAGEAGRINRTDPNSVRDGPGRRGPTRT